MCKNILAQAILILELDGDVIIDIDDLEMVLAHPEYFWLCLYVVPENNGKSVITLREGNKTSSYLCDADAWMW